LDDLKSARRSLAGGGLQPWSDVSAGIFLNGHYCQVWVGFELKQCCQTFYLRKRFWAANCFTRMLVDFIEEQSKK
jgi:hypothetical protein